MRNETRGRPRTASGRVRAGITTLLSIAAATGITASRAAPDTHTRTHLSAAGRPAPGLPGATRVNPFNGDPRIATAGAKLFTSMNCDGCHGEDAAGWVGPDLGDGRWRFGGSDTDVFDSIFFGRPKGMPAFGGVLGERGVWVLVTYLRSLKAPADQPTESWPGH